MDLPRLGNQVEAYLWHRSNSQEGHDLELTMSLSLKFLRVVAFDKWYDSLKFIIEREREREKERERKKKEESKKGGATK
jgi:hypothetical protein